MAKEKELANYVKIEEIEGQPKKTERTWSKIEEKKPAETPTSYDFNESNMPELAGVEDGK